MGPPPVVRIYIEQVKPGKNAAHEKSESAWARTFARGNYPAHYIALDAMAGGNESWFVESHSSFADVEKAEKASDAEPLKSELQQASSMDGEYLSGNRTLIALLRRDLTYEPEGAPSLSKTRYMNVITVRIKMGTEQRLVSAVNDLIKIYKNVAMPQAAMAYQVISGAPSGTYLIFEPMAALADWDKYPAIMESIRATAARKFDAVEKDFADFSTFEEGRLMSINPHMSYPSREVIAGDPAFWAPKPKPAAAEPKKTAAKHTGQ
jgi:hypothetical protein